MNTLHNKRLRQAFGETEDGFADVPTKISNVKVARIFHGERMGCSFCFPHGWETVNSTGGKNFKSWKFKKKKQWSSKKTSYKGTTAKKGGERFLNDGDTRNEWTQWYFRRFSRRYDYPPYKWPYNEPEL